MNENNSSDKTNKFSYVYGYHNLNGSRVVFGGVQVLLGLVDWRVRMRELIRLKKTLCRALYYEDEFIVFTYINFMIDCLTTMIRSTWVAVPGKEGAFDRIDKIA